MDNLENLVKASMTTQFIWQSDAHANGLMHSMKIYVAPRAF
jgi:hypothetical protein